MDSRRTSPPLPSWLPVYLSNNSTAIPLTQKKRRFTFAPSTAHINGIDMTEQELLAQPQSEYMSNAQQAFFRNLLVRQRGDLAVRVGAELEEIAKLEPATAEEDLASRETQRSWDLRMLERDRQMLSKIEQAIARIDSNEYGWCEETGEPIGLRRLLLRPTATLCVEAKARQEQRERHVA